MLTNNDLPLVPNRCEENPFIRYEAPHISDPTTTLAEPRSFCVDEVNQIGDSIEAITSQRYYFLSEIQEIIGGTNGEKLPCFLREVNRRHYGGGSSFNIDNATLVIDIACSLAEPIVIPSRFTIAGTGLDGEGRLTFHDLSDGIFAIQLDDKANDKVARNITIRDIRIAGEGFQPFNRS